MSENSNLENKSKLFPRDEFRLVLLIALVSIAFATVFTATIELEFITRFWARILLYALLISFSILVVSTLVVVRIKKSREALETTDNIIGQLLEIAISARLLKVMIPVVGVIIIFLGWDRMRNIEEDIIKQIDPKGNIATMKALIDSSRILQDNLKEYVLPVGTIVAFSRLQELPDSWAPCDGRAIKISDDSTFITPNLVNRFIIGTTDSTFGDNLPKKLGEFGGEVTHSHEIEFEIDASTELIKPTSEGVERIRESLDLKFSYPVRHSHERNLNYIGQTQMSNNLPPYYSLIFIIKYK